MSTVPTDEQAKCWRCQRDPNPVPEGWHVHHGQLHCEIVRSNAYPCHQAVARLRAAEEVWSRTSDGSYELEAAYQTGYPNGPSAEAEAAYEEATTRYWQALTEVVEARKAVEALYPPTPPVFYPHPAPSDTVGRCGCATCRKEVDRG